VTIYSCSVVLDRFTLQSSPLFLCVDLAIVPLVVCAHILKITQFKEQFYLLHTDIIFIVTKWSNIYKV